MEAKKESLTNDGNGSTVENCSTLEAIHFRDGKLEILDQLLLPMESKYISIKNTQDGWKAIKTMQVRGAPAIAIVGCLSLVVELNLSKHLTSKDKFKSYVDERLNYLVTARPTAINMSRAKDDLKRLTKVLMDDDDINVDTMKQRLIEAIEKMLQNDIADNRAIGDFGADHIVKHGKHDNHIVLTHCNTGSLATSGYGTALGIIRSLHGLQALDHVYCTETRPYNQGARLTAYELVYEKIPATLICDSMVAALMSSKKVTAVIVGADRVASNGDTANKIGTFQLALLAKHFNVPFYVAAPWTSIDLNIPNGSAIPIEERPGEELTYIGDKRIAAPGIGCWNPAFDVTPAEFITGGIVTEKGVLKPEKLCEFGETN